MDEAQSKAEAESIKLLDDYRRYEKHVYRKLKHDKEHTDIAPKYDEIEKDLDEKINKLREGLLDIELSLQQALAHSMATFKQKIEAIIADQAVITGDFQKYVSEEV